MAGVGDGWEGQQECRQGQGFRGGGGWEPPINGRGVRGGTDRHPSKTCLDSSMWGAASSNSSSSPSPLTTSQLLSSFGLPGRPGSFLLEFHVLQLLLCCCQSLSWCQSSHFEESSTDHSASLLLLPVFCGLDFQPLLFCVLLVAALSHLLFHNSQPPSSPAGAHAIDDAEVPLGFFRTGMIMCLR